MNVGLVEYLLDITPTRSYDDVDNTPDGEDNTRLHNHCWDRSVEACIQPSQHAFHLLPHHEHPEANQDGNYDVERNTQRVGCCPMGSEFSCPVRCCFRFEDQERNGRR